MTDATTDSVQGAEGERAGQAGSMKGLIKDG
jgi:hypothetical protein